MTSMSLNVHDVVKIEIGPVHESRGGVTPDHDTRHITITDKDGATMQIIVYSASVGTLRLAY